MVHTSGPPIFEYILYITGGLVVCAIIFALIVFCIHLRRKRRTCRDSDEDTIVGYLAKDKQLVMKRQMEEANDL